MIEELKKRIAERDADHAEGEHEAYMAHDPSDIPETSKREELKWLMEQITELEAARQRDFKITPDMPIVMTYEQLIEQVKASVDFIRRGEDGSFAIFATGGDGALLLGSGDPKVRDEDGNGVWVTKFGVEEHGPMGHSGDGPDVKPHRHVSQPSGVGWPD